MRTIGKLATETAVTTDTVRYYEKEGLLAPATRTGAGYRLYDEDPVRRLRFIRQAQQCGFSLTEIRELLTLKNSDAACCRDVKSVAIAKKLQLEHKIRALQAMSGALSGLIAICDDETRPLVAARISHDAAHRRRVALAQLVLSRSALLAGLFGTAAAIGLDGLSASQAALMLGIIGAVYLVTRRVYLPVPHLEFFRLIPGGRRLPQALKLGLTLPAALAREGVRFKACRISMRGHGYTDADFPLEVEFVPAGAPEVIRLQMENYRYWRP